MKIISHRGNINGPSESENNPAQVKKVLKMGYDCEIDVWLIDGCFFLGHDKPHFPVKDEFLSSAGLWCHAKNLPALHKMLENGKMHCFWHQNDDFTLTSEGFIWTFPNKIVTEKSVIVDLNEHLPIKRYNCFGVCRDYIN